MKSKPLKALLHSLCSTLPWLPLVWEGNLTLASWNKPFPPLLVFLQCFFLSQQEELLSTSHVYPYRLNIEPQKAGSDYTLYKHIYTKLKITDLKLL